MLIVIARAALPDCLYHSFKSHRFPRAVKFTLVQGGVQWLVSAALCNARCCVSGSFSNVMPQDPWHRYLAFPHLSPHVLHYLVCETFEMHHYRLGWDGVSSAWQRAPSKTFVNIGICVAGTDFIL